MTPFRCALALLLAAFVFATPAAACDGFQDIPNSEMKEYRDVLEQTDADPLDRLFSYEKLVCSDKPVIRAYAMRTGMQTASDPILRQQIAFDAMMALPRIDLELTTAKLGPKSKAYIRKVGDTIIYNVKFRDRAKGCISLYYDSFCDEGRALTIKGDKLLYNAYGFVGTLELSETGAFIGTVRYEGEVIPAKITLF